MYVIINLDDIEHLQPHKNSVDSPMFAGFTLVGEVNYGNVFVPTVNITTIRSNRRCLLT